MKEELEYVLGLVDTALTTNRVDAVFVAKAYNQFVTKFTGLTKKSTGCHTCNRKTLVEIAHYIRVELKNFTVVEDCNCDKNKQEDGKVITSNNKSTGAKKRNTKKVS